jgi:hypothetical protein
MSLPIFCIAGGLFVRASYIHWFVYTVEDRKFFRNRGEYREGVPSTARCLEAEIEPIPDPDTATREHPDWAAFKFPNGEWVFGRGIDSHGIGPGEGTVVLKDSRGRVRIFFGHVCGHNAWLMSTFGEDQTLDTFYAKLADHSLREWVPDP